MATTRSTDVTEAVYAKMIETLIAEYQYDEVTAVPFFRYASLVDKPSATASFPRITKDSVASVALETTSLTATTFDTSAVDIAVSRVGIARTIAETAMEDSIFGRALYVDMLVKDAAKLFGISMDTDGTGQFGSLTASVGTTTVALTIAVVVSAMASQRANKARGAQVIHLHDFQIKDLQAAQAAATATPWATFFQPNADHTAFGGYFMGAPIYSSSLNATANAAADRVGAVWSQGQASPAYAAFALVVKRMPSSLTQPDVLQDASVWASFCRYGVGIPCNNFGTKIISKNL
jgi:hypothetical protein